MIDEWEFIQLLVLMFCLVQFGSAPHPQFVLEKFGYPRMYRYPEAVSVSPEQAPKTVLQACF